MDTTANLRNKNNIQIQYTSVLRNLIDIFISIKYKYFLKCSPRMKYDVPVFMPSDRNKF